MKYYLILPMLFLCSVLIAQDQLSSESSEKLVIENEKLKVVEHFSMSQGDVCGEGLHHHEPHLTFVINDAKVQITTEEGEAQVIEVNSGTSIWSESEKHSVINIGENPTKMLLIYLKEQD